MRERDGLGESRFETRPRAANAARRDFRSLRRANRAADCGTQTAISEKHGCQQSLAADYSRRDGNGNRAG